MKNVATLDVFGAIRTSGVNRKPNYDTISGLRKATNNSLKESIAKSKELHAGVRLRRGKWKKWENTKSEMQVLARIEDQVDELKPVTRRAMVKRKTPEVANKMNGKRVKGPCIWGHEDTTAVDQARRKIWHTVPYPSPWEGVQVGAPLCQKCYEKLYRHTLENGYKWMQPLCGPATQADDTARPPGSGL